MSKQVQFPDYKGRILAGLLDTPADKPNFPLVILMHGNPGWKEEPHLETLAHALAREGIGALRFDAPGLGASQGTWADDYRASNFISAISDATDFAGSVPGVDSSKIALWGHSMGGMAVLVAASRNQGKYVAVCGSEPATGQKDIDPEELSEWKRTGYKHIKSDHHGDFHLPYAFYEDRIQYDTEKEVVALKLPVLFIAGTTDNLVESSSVHRAYLAAVGPKQYLELPMDHFYKRHKNLLEVVNAHTLTFFQTVFQGPSS
jgi:alpha-beta hydrolase superfamily lysophospholipase